MEESSQKNYEAAMDETELENFKKWRESPVRIYDSEMSIG